MKRIEDKAWRWALIGLELARAAAATALENQKPDNLCLTDLMIEAIAIRKSNHVQRQEAKA